jgi:hypothetical protein
MAYRACPKCFNEKKMCYDKECIDHKTPISLKYINCLVLPQNQDKCQKNRLFILGQDVLDIVFSYIFNPKDQKKIVLEGIKKTKPVFFFRYLLDYKLFRESNKEHLKLYKEYNEECDKRHRKDWYYIYNFMIKSMPVYGYCEYCKSEDKIKAPRNWHICYKCKEEGEERKRIEESYYDHYSDSD